MQNQIYFGDNLPVLQSIPGESVDLIYIEYQEDHYCKVLVNRIFGRTSIINEIFWTFWLLCTSRKSDTKAWLILWSTKDTDHYLLFNKAWFFNQQ